MNRNKSFARKVGYLIGIAALFVPISFISAPATSREEGGGILTEMRRKNRLSQAQLGKIDPASASMSLATLGMRGVAANLLWGQAIHYKKTENWDAFMAALNQITKLQPNFVSVWQFQAWNISYNVSVEFDDFRHRYHWVKKGVNYLTDGIEFNEEEPLLLSDLGWFFGHKLGRADEYIQFRRLFREDDDFHEELPLTMNESLRGPDQRPDNWLVANYWFTRAQDAVDRGARLKRLSTYYWAGDKAVIDKKQTPLRGKNPLIFHSEPAKALINHANAIEEEGYLDEKGVLAWETAEKAWREYGERDILSSWGITIHLNDEERATREADEAAAELKKITPGLREEIRELKIDKLAEAEKNVLDIPETTRTQEQYMLAREVEEKLKISPIELALAAPEAIRDRVQRLAMRVETNRELARIIDRYREIVNFKYWLQRCIAEQEENTVEARRLVLNASKAFDDTDLEGARILYEQAWDKWAIVFERYPVMVDDVEGEDVMVAVQKYHRLMGQLDLPFPPPGFKLYNLLKAYEGDYEFEDVTKAVEASQGAATAAQEAAQENNAEQDEESVDEKAEENSDNPVTPTSDDTVPDDDSASNTPVASSADAADEDMDATGETADDDAANEDAPSEDPPSEAPVNENSADEDAPDEDALDEDGTEDAGTDGDGEDG